MKLGAAVCIGEYEEDANPGWWLVTPGRPTITATGTITCTGTLDGRQLRGVAGPMAYRGAYDGQFAGVEAPVLGDTCLAGSGTGSWETTLPMADGSDVALSGPMRFEYVNAVWLVQGDMGSFALRLVFEGYPRPGSPLDEDCVRKRLQHVSAKAEGTLR